MKGFSPRPKWHPSTKNLPSSSYRYSSTYYEMQWSKHRFIVFLRPYLLDVFIVIQRSRIIKSRISTFPMSLVPPSLYSLSLMTQRPGAQVPSLSRGKSSHASFCVSYISHVRDPGPCHEPTQIIKRSRQTQMPWASLSYLIEALFTNIIYVSSST